MKVNPQLSECEKYIQYIKSNNILLNKFYQSISFQNISNYKIKISPLKMLQSANHKAIVEKENHNPFKASNKSKSLSTVRQLLTEMDLSTKKRELTHRKREPFLDRQQIRKQMKQKWRDPGYCNLDFSHYKALKGRFLNQWELQRICLANRSYQYPKDFKGFKQCSQSKEFPKLTKEIYPQKFQKYLASVEEKSENLTFDRKKLATEVSTITFCNNRFIQTKPKQIFQAFNTQNRPFGMGTVVWKKGQAARKLKTLDY